MEPVRELYDEVAPMVGDEVDFGVARELFAGHEGLRTPRTALPSAPYSGPREVTLR